MSDDSRRWGERLNRSVATRLASRLTKLVPGIAAFYFGVALPWCLGALVRALPEQYMRCATIGALGLWVFLGMIAITFSCSSEPSDRRTTARCVAWGYMVNMVGGIVLAVLVASRMGC